MSTSVERLRRWLLVGAGLLVLVIGGFLGYAHWRAHRFLTNLPQKLGVNIRRETNGFTYSQSSQGRTIYTIHAAKAVEHLNNKVTLHDVGIVLYGREQNRADRIYGKEFEYDQAAGIIRAVGEVHIDLQAPQAADADAKMDYAAGKDLHDNGEAELKDERLIHVKTSGLVFMQKQGLASTDEEIEFASGGMTGQAKGADYNANSGVVVLHQDVKVNGLQRDRPVVLTASYAELDRANLQVLLTHARYVQVASAGETAQAEHVVAHLRKDATVERLEAEGNVTLTNSQGGRMMAPRGEATLNEKNQPQSAVMTGGVQYVVDSPLRQGQGAGAEGRASFDRLGRLEHVSLVGPVQLSERVRSSETMPWQQRELHARTVDLALGSDAAGKAQLRDAKATGDARLRIADEAKNDVARGANGKATSSEAAGDLLTVHFVRLNGADHVSEAHGTGHTFLRRVDSKGIVSTSSGDTLVAHFRTGESVGPSTGKGGDQLADATQQGHVTMTRTAATASGKAAAAAASEERASADRAVYAGDQQQTTLTGSVQISDATSTVWADRVVAEQVSGDATADGSVKASYSQGSAAQEPVHVLAARAEMKHDSQTAFFYGAPGRDARLWQGASQVDAPVLQFDRNARRMVAHGAAGGSAAAVHTTLVSAPNKTGTKGASVSASTAQGKTQVIRLASRELVYDDGSRQADFTGGVRVESVDGQMNSQRVVVYLQQATVQPHGADARGAKGDAAKDGFIGGSVERIVASGDVTMQQPGRQAFGERLVYTADDGISVLTGTANAPPRVVDAVRGTVTGSSLSFHTGDNSVLVSNGRESGAEHRVRTETRVKNTK